MTEGVNIYTQIDKDWDNCMLRVGRRITESFERDNMLFTEALIATNCTRLLMRWIYKHMIVKKRIVALEQLTNEEKESTWEFVKEICEGKTNSKQVMHEVAMAFHLIEYFLNEQK